MLWPRAFLTGNKFKTGLDNIGVEKSLYSDELVTSLAGEVEETGNKVPEKMYREELISQSDKVEFSRYIATLWKRVPNAMSRAQESVRYHAENVRQNGLGNVDRFIDKHPDSEDVRATVKAEISATINSTKESPPNIFSSVQANYRGGC